jgi:signal transduction histidine kinase
MRDDWNAAYDDLPHGLLVAGPDGQVVALNTVGVRLLGVSAEDAAERDFREIIPLADSAGRDWWACTDPYGGLHVRTGQPERLLELSDGPHSGRQLLVSARYVREGQKVTRLVISFRAASSHERLDREQANLVATVAHEIRSPLTGVKGFTATLLAKWDRFTDEQKRTMLTAINADADRVTRLLSDLLDVSRIDAGRLVLRRRVVDLAAKVERVVAGEVAAGHPAGRFDVRVAGPLPDMWLDADKVQQVIGNLVDNALRHGEGTVHIELRPGWTMAGEPGAVLVVSDEGEGIGPEARARIFTRFWQAGNARTGTGLGLYIVKGLVQAHGGTIDLEDAPAGGARFVVRLPAGRPPYEG